MIFSKLLSNNTGVPGYACSEIMGQFKLAMFAAMGSHQFLHDLKQNPSRIFGNGAGGGQEDFVPQRPKGVQPIVHTPFFHGFQQMDDGKGYAEPLGFGKFFDAPGMEVGVDHFSSILTGRVFTKNLVDNVQQLAITTVKKQHAYPLQTSNWRSMESFKGNSIIKINSKFNKIFQI